MQCKKIPALDDAELLAYLDQAASRDVETHIEQCPACRTRAGVLAQTQAAFQAQFYRASCPSSDELRDFHFQLMPPTQSEATARHLEICPHCTRELFVDFVESTPAERSDHAASAQHKLTEFMDRASQILGQVKLLVATLIDSGGAHRPAYALRGEAGGNVSGSFQTHMYQVDDSLISLVVLPDPDFPEHLAIEGQALLSEPEPSAPPMQVHLWQQERLAALCVLDAAGDFAIPRLTPGRYELIFSSPRYKIKVPHFQVGPAAVHVA